MTEKHAIITQIVKEHAIDSNDGGDLQETRITTGGTINVNLFEAKIINNKRDEGEAHLTHLEVTLTPTTGGEEKKLTSECEDQAFHDLAAGSYTVKAQDAVGYSCICQQTINVTEGETQTVNFEYIRTQQ